MRVEEAIQLLEQDKWVYVWTLYYYPKTQPGYTHIFSWCPPAGVKSGHDRWLFVGTIDELFDKTLLREGIKIAAGAPIHSIAVTFAEDADPAEIVWFKHRAALAGIHVWESS